MVRFSRPQILIVSVVSIWYRYLVKNTKVTSRETQLPRRAYRGVIGPLGHGRVDGK